MVYQTESDLVPSDDKRGEGHRLLRLPRQSLSSQLLHDITPKQNDATVPGWCNPWMRSNQQPFARGIIAGRVYCVSVRAVDWKLAKCISEWMRNCPGPVKFVDGQFSAGNFTAFVVVRVSRMNSRRTQPSKETCEMSGAKAFSYFYLPWRSFTGPRRIPRKLCARLLASGNIVWRVTLWSEVHRTVFVSEGASKCKIKVNSLLSSLAWNKETIFAPCLRPSFTMFKRLSHESPVCRQTSYWNITTRYRSRTPR